MKTNKRLHDDLSYLEENESDLIHRRCKKSSALYFTIIGVWVSTSAILWVEFITSLYVLNSELAKILAGLIIFLVDLGWLYGLYHLSLVSFTALYQAPLFFQDPTVVGLSSNLPIAVFYTVCDDFQHSAALSCISQDYENFHVYILDDSSKDEMKAAVDAFQSRFEKKVTVIRRHTHNGFKAGNLNNALSLLSEEFVYLALVDSDTRLPSEFLTKVASLLEANPSEGFVQALHIANPPSQSGPAMDLGDIVRIGWTYYQPVRNKFGLPMCYGHGVLIRRSALQSVGAFPEIVSEDIALTLRMRRSGIRGFFTTASICGEDFPNDFYTFRKRLSRWVSADLECFSNELVPFLSQRGSLIIEKLDALFRGAKVPLSLLFLPTVVLVGLMPILFPEWEKTIGWFTITTAILTIFSPYLCFVLDMLGQPKRLILFISRLTTTYCSNVLLITVRALETILLGKAEFHVSGAKDETELETDLIARRYLSINKAGYPLMGFFEFVTAMLLIVLGTETGNLIMIGIAMSIGLAPAIYNFGWENRWVTLLTHLSFGLIVLGIASPLFFGFGSIVYILALAALSILLF